MAFFLRICAERTRHGRHAFCKMLPLMRIDQFRGGGLPDPENASASRPYRGCDELRIVRAQAQLFPACARRIYWFTRKSSAHYKCNYLQSRMVNTIASGSGSVASGTTRNWVAYVSFCAPKQMYR